MIIVGGIFLVEALSVIFQVGYFKMTHGKRIFRMAPLHHHFELKGWPEPKIIVRFWIIAVILSLISLSLEAEIRGIKVLDIFVLVAVTGCGRVKIGQHPA